MAYRASQYNPAQVSRRDVIALFYLKRRICRCRYTLYILIHNWMGGESWLCIESRQPETTLKPGENSRKIHLDFGDLNSDRSDSKLEGNWRRRRENSSSIFSLVSVSLTFLCVYTNSRKKKEGGGKNLIEKHKRRDALNLDSKFRKKKKRTMRVLTCALGSH